MSEFKSDIEKKIALATMSVDDEIVFAGAPGPTQVTRKSWRENTSQMLKVTVFTEGGPGYADSAFQFSKAQAESYMKVGDTYTQETDDGDVDYRIISKTWTFVDGGTLKVQIGYEKKH